ncbi:hypothetical protein [Rhodococcoides kroppenstedtii]|uniref:hypothetical protein n=1 Tax=Rhodococcoides kroppenstedtii TaxID=293050 RepID=UPI0028EFD3ED|nr:hypothetical protein [Rhodococcus kroppenstedtii]
MQRRNGFRRGERGDRDSPFGCEEAEAVNVFFPNLKPRLRAAWTSAGGTKVLASEMPIAWVRALERLGADLHVRQYAGRVTHVEWVVQYDPDGGFAWLNSAVTTEAMGRAGFFGSGSGAHMHADEETIFISMADLVSTAVAECGVAWPHADGGGFLTPRSLSGVATWSDRSGPDVPIGTLATAKL